MNPGGFAPIMFSLWVSLYRILVRAEWVRLGCFRPGCISINPCFDVKRSTSATQRILEEAWNHYDLGEISTGHFLRLCGSLYLPSEYMWWDCVFVIFVIVMTWFLYVEQLVRCGLLHEWCWCYLLLLSLFHFES